LPAKTRSKNIDLAADNVLIASQIYQITLPSLQNIDYQLFEFDEVADA
jgi:hypothetical protein